jgi:hypothetical protein
VKKQQQYRSKRTWFARWAGLQAAVYALAWLLTALHPWLDHAHHDHAEHPVCVAANVGELHFHTDEYTSDNCEFCQLVPVPVGLPEYPVWEISTVVLPVFCASFIVASHLKGSFIAFAQPRAPPVLSFS